MDTILFDLDGTLLPMDQEKFIELYFGLMSAHVSKNGFDPQALIAFVWAGTKAMLQNDGKRTNECVFWEIARHSLGAEKTAALRIVLDEYYAQVFPAAKSATGQNPLAAQSIKLLKQKGYNLILATNPVFPAVATMQRIAWAGLDPHDFSHITTYENASFSKPNPAYFTEIITSCSKSMSQCMMVGNDTDDDYGAHTAGMALYLIDDCLIDREKRDMTDVRIGSFTDFYRFCENLPYIDSI